MSETSLGLVYAEYDVKLKGPLELNNEVKEGKVLCAQSSLVKVYGSNTYRPTPRLPDPATHVF